MNRRKLIDRYAVLLLSVFIMSEPVLSYGNMRKQSEEPEPYAYARESLDSDQTVLMADKSEEMVSWKIFFVDEESKQIELSAIRSGTIVEGEELVIPFANRLIVNGHRWSATTESPYRVNVYGPGEKIIYITYSDDGIIEEDEDPESSERERFERYLECAKKADAEITGESADEIRFLILKNGK